MLLGALVITDFAESRGWLEPLSSTALDSLILVTERRLVDDVVIVEITDDDYRNLFGGRSPLDRARLRDLLVAIRAGAPRLIVVDLDTSEDWQYEVWHARVPAACQPAIVWAQGARSIDGGHDGGTRLVPVPFEDGRHTLSPCATGLAVFPQDRDGLIRRYLRTIPITSSAAGTTRVDSLAWAAVKADRSQVQESVEEDADLVLNFAGDRYSFPRYTSSGVLDQASAGAAWKDRGPLRSRIVVVGGAFRGEDEHRTPLGRMTGADVVAQAIASETRGGGIRRINRLREKVVELAVAVLIVYLGYRGHRRTALTADIIGIPLFAFAGSWFAFSTLGRWLDFAPYWVSMAVQQALSALNQDSEAHGETAEGP